MQFPNPLGNKIQGVSALFYLMAKPVILNTSISAPPASKKMDRGAIRLNEMKEKSDSAQFHLSLIRTELSNSRTMLAHMQAFVGLLISAIGVSKFLDSSWIFDACGFLLVVVAFAVLFRGALLYRKTKALIETEKTSVSSFDHESGSYMDHTRHAEV